MIFFIREGLRRADNDRVSGVNADRIDIFHIADGDGCVVAVPHDLIFDLFAALHALFHQHLVYRGEFQCVFHQGHEFLRVIRKSAAGTAKGKGRAQHHRVADFSGDFQAFFHGGGNIGRQGRLAKRITQAFEQVTVFSLFDGRALCPEQLHTALLQDTFLFQLDRQVQPGLPADSGKDGVRTFMADDLRHIFQRQRLHIDLIRDGGIRHDGRRVGIAQDHFVALFLQGQTCLRAGVVEFGCLTDDDRAGTYHKNFMDICSLRHCVCSPPSV